MIRLAALLWLAALPAFATQDGWPALYDVTGVATDDVLNVRAAPSADAEIIGSLAPDATDVEVIEANDALTWGRVNTGERSGWASLAFLQRHGGQWDGKLPAITRCFGTEPFWGLTRADGILEYSDPDGTGWSATVASETGSSGRRDRHVIAAVGVTLVLRGELCSDGMSDRLFGLSADLLTTVPGGVTMHSGCCTIAPN